MCLERAFSGYLAYFSRLAFEVIPRALSLERKERGSVLSPSNTHTGARFCHLTDTHTPDLCVCVSVCARSS